MVQTILTMQWNQAQLRCVLKRDAEVMLLLLSRSCLIEGGLSVPPALAPQT
jgi:hypothetical protein